MKLGWVCLGLLSLACVSCGSGSGAATNCMGMVDANGGPTGSCGVDFTCDSGDFAILCTQSGADFQCQCSSGTMSAIPTFNVTPFQCTSEAAALAANDACGFDLQLAK